MPTADNQTGNESKAAKAAVDKSQLTTLAHVLLTPDQTAQVQADTGVEVTRLLVQRVSRSLARDIDPGVVSILRLTWCW
jgi:hypothetical protein